MSIKKLKITVILSKIPLLFLYISFFSVQLFNYGDSNQKDSLVPIPSYRIQLKQQQLSSNKLNTEKHKCAKVRLNKRFQPETLFLNNTYFVSIINAEYLIACNTIFCFEEIIPITFLQTHLMRGPPVVA
jgi:hypothetical protein